MSVPGIGPIISSAMVAAIGAAMFVRQRSSKRLSSEMLKSEATTGSALSSD
jgi:hypothetical protein